MRASPRLLVVPLLAALVGACGGSSGPSSAASAASLPAASAPASAGSVAPSVAPSASAAPSAAASTAPSAAAATTGPTAAPTAIDPCQLVTKDEADKLAGTTLSAGKETDVQNVLHCNYQAAGVVFVVSILLAPNQAAVNQGKAQFLAGLQKQAGTDLKVSVVSGIGDAAAVATVGETVSGMTINGSSIYVLKGLDFFAISDLGIGKPVASAAALEAQATTSLGRIP